MPDHATEFMDAMRLLVDLQRVCEVTQAFSGCLQPEEIAQRTTDRLVTVFDFAFARIWLVEPDQSALRLVASSGMYTRKDGTFARVPMGAFKVGKIAQNRISFLSNTLPNEPWVKDRDWAIAHNITGFAGYPLAIPERVVGVLAVFSHHALSPEFLEVLQGLCTTLTVALDNALLHQREKQTWQIASRLGIVPLSEQLAVVLPDTRLILVGTERSLSASLNWIFLQVGEILQQVGCSHCRLTYSRDRLSLEAMVFPPEELKQPLSDWATSTFGELLFVSSSLGGTLQTLIGANEKVIQLVLALPYTRTTRGDRLQIRCTAPVLQMAFTHLAYLAGLTVQAATDPTPSTSPLLTDDATLMATHQPILWLDKGSNSQPASGTGTILGRVTLAITPLQLREAVEAVAQGKSWGISPPADVEVNTLSEREREIMQLLVQGLRDRDIANHLIISESTVKFHMNNVLTKLKARTRYQALYQAIAKGWIQFD